MQHALHTQQLLGFGLGEVGHGNAGGHGDDVGNVLRRYLMHRFLGIFGPLLLGRGALVFHGGLLVAQLGSTLEVLLGDGLVLIGADLAQLVVHLAQLVGQGHVADAHAGARLVHNVDGLVGQETVLDIAVRQRDGGLKRLVGEMHLMMRLVAVAQPLHDAQGLLLVGLADRDGLETALEGAVLFQVLAIFVDGGGADDLDLAARQRRLEDGGGVDGSLGRTRADKGMHLVDEQDDVAGVLDLLDALLQAVLEFAAVLAACHKGGHVEREQALAAQDIGNLVGHDELRQALGDGGLAHAGLADEQRIVLLTAGEDLHDALDLAGAADDRVELAVARLLRKVGAELLQGAVGHGAGRLEGVAARVHGALAHQIVERGADVVALHAQARKHVERRALVLAHDAEQQMLGGDIALPHLHGLAQAVLEHALDARRERKMAGHVGALVDGGHLADALHHGVIGHAQTLEGLGGKAVLFLDEAQQDMFGAHIGLMQGACLVLGQDEHLARLVRELLK